MAATYSFVVDAVGNPESIIAQSVCRKITVRQNDPSDASLLAFNYRAPSASSSPVRFGGGEALVIERPGHFFDKAEIIGYIETTASSATFAQIEE